MRWLLNLLRLFPLRKFLALAASILWAWAVAHSVRSGLDIPERAGTLLQWGCPVLWGYYFGTSAYEAKNKPPPA